MLEWLKEAADYPPPLLSHRETLRLVGRAKRGGDEGRAAEEELIRRNIRLVIKTAFRYREQATATVSEDDLLQTALIGFHAAVHKYDHRRGVLFSTYAVRAMRSTILRTLANEGLELRLPVNRQLRLRRLNHIAAQFQARHDRRPTVDELAHMAGLTVEQIRYAVRFPSVVMSLDDPVAGRKHTDVGEILGAPDDGNEPASTRSRLIEVIESILPERLARLVMLRYGLAAGHGDGLSEAEIARKLQCKRQQVSAQLERARELLRASEKGEELRELLGP